MRRLAFLIALLSLTALANSAVAQDSTRQDTTRQDTTRRRLQKRVHVTSPGEVDTAKIRAPSRRDSSLVRHEMRRDSASAGSDTVANPVCKTGSPGNQCPKGQVDSGKPAKPPADSQPPKRPSAPH